MLRHPIKAQVIWVGVIHSAGILVFVVKHARSVKIVQVFVPFCPAAGTGLHDDSVGKHKIPLLGIVFSEPWKTGSAHDQNRCIRLVLS